MNLHRLKDDADARPLTPRPMKGRPGTPRPWGRGMALDAGIAAVGTAMTVVAACRPPDVTRPAAAVGRLRSISPP
jgi:hypothetical protein